jgi:polysaccharide export outer membrane protein
MSIKDFPSVLSRIAFCVPNHRYLMLILVLAVLLNSCRVWNPNRMFLTGSDYAYAEGLDSVQIQTIIRPGDRVQIQILTNLGYSLLTPGLDQGGQRIGAQGVILDVDVNGLVRMPLIDTITISGKSIRQAERTIEDRYKAHFKEPFAQLRVVNRRVYVFRGNETGVVVPLENENITLIEVLAYAGGIPPSGKAYRIKLVRGNLDGDFDIYLIDLRTPEGMQAGSSMVRHGDLVYIDPTFESGFLSQLLPFLAFITTSVSVIFLVLSLNRS